jgi:hypothetical protein
MWPFSPFATRVSFSTIEIISLKLRIFENFSTNKAKVKVKPRLLSTPVEAIPPI